MKSHMLYAPVLLLSLSMACGKAGHDKTARDVAVENIHAAQQLAATGAAEVSRPVPGTVADEVTPTPTPTPIPTPAPTPGAGPVVTNPPTAPAPGANPPAPANQPAPLPSPAPTNNAPAASPGLEETTSSVPTISSGVPTIDGSCKKSYLALEALEKDDNAGFEALKLNPESHKACYDALVTATGNIFSDLDTLGLPIPFTFSGQRFVLGSANWLFFASRIDALQNVLGMSEFLVNDQRDIVFADANERLEYIQLSIAELNAKDPATLTDADKDNLTILMSSLPVQLKTIETIVKRVNALTQVGPLAVLGFQMGQVSQILAQPPRAPVIEPAPAQPTSPATGTGSPNTPNTNTPNTPEPVTPAPEPEPEPTPIPDPTPAPLPTPPP